jgi:hypothetical protein
MVKQLSSVGSSNPMMIHLTEQVFASTISRFITISLLLLRKLEATVSGNSVILTGMLPVAEVAVERRLDFIIVCETVVIPLEQIRLQI